MEIVLLWLDDLDDLLFALSLLWERGRRVALQVGLVAAFCLIGIDASASLLAPLAAGVAAASVAAWAMGTAFGAYYYRRSQVAAA